ncbi:DUF6049 family protein [Microbacterium radiodurans]|uniref:2-oxoglutarate dehydrogenase n=1 Tax=Microbacterium radiodurans TaxID=661398 RepID=A0A5J5IT88_9MICO|nr:DUF6049 family protein [Microbacterium radiodurans]KAA9089243.1 2-oxoglutarate dehydrogenase [Microbacterium radiodurans]
MTDTPAASGRSRARELARPFARARRGSAARSGRAAITGLLVTGLLIVGGGMLGSPPAVAAAPTPTPSPTPSGTVVLSASPTGTGLVALGAEPAFSVRVRNDTAREVPAGATVVSLSRTPLASDAEVAGWLSPDSGVDPAEGRAFDEVARADTDDLGAGDERTTGIGVTAESLGDLPPGVYPILVSGAGEVARTVLTVARPDAAPRTVGIVVPVTAPARETGLLTSAELGELTAPDGELTEILGAVTGTPAILAVDPAVTAAIRVLGSSAPESARDWLDSLMGLPNERFALQFGDADLAVQIHAGLPGPLQPTTLSPYADPADFRVSGSSAAPTVPETGALLSVGGIETTASDVFWPATGTAGGDVVAAIDAQAGPDAAALSLVPGSTTPGAAAAVRAVAGSADLLVYDDTVSRELTAAAAQTDATERSARLAAATALTSLRGDAPLLAAIDRPAAVDQASLRAAITTVTSTPAAVPASLTELRSAAPVPVEVAAVAAAEDRVSALTGFLDREADLARFATALVEPDQLTARERTSILQVMGNGWFSDLEAWRVAASDHDAATTTTLGSIGIANPGTINFLATSAPISVTVRNDLPWPVSVVLLAETDDPRLIVQRSTTVEAGAQQNTRVDVPVEARVGSGETDLQLRLLSAAMVPIGSTELISLTVRAEWESVGITAVVVIVVVLLAGGIVRTIIKVRRRRATPKESV